VAESYDAVLVVAFGAPERAQDVTPFLENVLRGRDVPRDRLLEVAGHYRHVGGISPLNEQIRTLVAALRRELAVHGLPLTVYWGNRNWHPLLSETVAQMARDGVQRALAFFTSAYSSYSSCRQYLEDIERARTSVGAAAPRIDKLRAYFNHPGFIQPMVERVRAALAEIPEPRRSAARVVYTAHSIPLAMAERCQYAAQVAEAARLVSRELEISHFEVAYQSRSGPPAQPWLEPDIRDTLRKLHAAQVGDVVVVPIGFLSDHVEILYDLDTEAKKLCDELGMNMIRAATVGSHAGFVSMIRELIEERVQGAPPRSLGDFGPAHDQCPPDCCVYHRAGH
jgi:ferrochelatase